MTGMTRLCLLYLVRYVEKLDTKPFIVPKREKWEFSFGYEMHGLKEQLADYFYESASSRFAMWNLCNAISYSCSISWRTMRLALVGSRYLSHQCS